MDHEIFTEQESTLLKSLGTPESAQQLPTPKEVVFKPYSTHDNYLFPPSTNDYISQHHIARFISHAIDRIGVGSLIDKYKGGGASAYHPAMMQKDKISIKPGYNEGIATNNGFVAGYDVSQLGGDGSNFIDLMKITQDNLGTKPGLVHTDGAYGNEENMAYLDEEGIQNYLKFNSYRKEHSKKWHRERVRKEDLIYDQENDRYRCPRGKYLNFQCEKKRKTKSGYAKIVRSYKTNEDECQDCPYKEYCTSSNCRSIEVSSKYEALKSIARENLGSEKGEELRHRRGFEVETVFGDKKENNQRRRFLLRGIKRVLIES